MSHPGLVALFDQINAEFGVELELMIELYKRLEASQGADQAGADLTAYFIQSDRLDEYGIRALLATAIRTIAESRVNHPEGRS